MKTRVLTFCLLLPFYDLVSATDAATPPPAEPMTPLPASGLVPWATPLVEGYEYLLGTMLAGGIVHGVTALYAAWDGEIGRIHDEYKRSLGALFPTPESRESEVYKCSKEFAGAVGCEFMIIGKMLCVLRNCEVYEHLSSRDFQQLIITLRSILLAYDELKNNRGFESLPEAWWRAQRKDFRNGLALLVVPATFGGFSRKALVAFGDLLYHALSKYDESLRARLLVAVAQIMMMFEEKGIVKDTHGHEIVEESYCCCVGAGEAGVVRCSATGEQAIRGRISAGGHGRYKRCFSV